MNRIKFSETIKDIKERGGSVITLSIAEAEALHKSTLNEIANLRDDIQQARQLCEEMVVG